MFIDTTPETSMFNNVSALVNYCEGNEIHGIDFRQILEVVFSEDDEHYSWCSDELAKIYDFCFPLGIDLDENDGIEELQIASEGSSISLEDIGRLAMILSANILLEKCYVDLFSAIYFPEEDIG